MSRTIPTLLCVILSTAAWAGPYHDHRQAGLAHQKAGNHAAARAEFEKALAVQGITPAQVAEATFQLGQSYSLQRKWTPALAALNRALNMDGASPELKARAHVKIGQINNRPWAWERARGSFLRALAAPDIPPELALAARKGLLKALLNGRQYAAARDVMQVLVADESLAAAYRLDLRISIAKMCLYEREFKTARAELAKALGMEGVTAADKADIQLYVARSYYDAQDYKRARPELLRVLEMPGAGAHRGGWTYTPAREANIRLHLQGLTDTDRKYLKVMFVGSSHTMRGKGVPQLVEALAASAPGDRLRIVSGSYVRSGTTIDTFWKDGDVSGTARHLLASEPWDVVVLETFFRTSRENREKYGRLFHDLAASNGARTVLYETPVGTAERKYPDEFKTFHEENLALAGLRNARLAPTVAAFMRYLGDEPTAEQFGYLYSDALHASGKGYYLVACCIYAALTGDSPVGLYHPAGTPEAEARELQELASQSFQQSDRPRKDAPVP